MKVPWKNRFAFEVQFAIRFDEPIFKLDCAWHEKLMYKHQNALWWPRFNLTFLGVRFGIALWIGAGVINPETK